MRSRYPASACADPVLPPPAKDAGVNWYTTKIADAATLEVLRARLDMQVEEARRRGGLDDRAQIYIVVLQDAVRLFVNEAARTALPVIGSLALLPSPAPRETQRERALLAREADEA
jgi:hypothetical protein